MEQTLPDRQSIRKRGWDYRSAGCYFVTINTHANHALFGTIVNGRVVLNAAGRIAADCWKEIPAHFPRVALDEFVIMPNHLHGVLRLEGLNTSSPPPQFGKPQAGSLGTVVGAYKAAVTREMNRRGLTCQTRSAGASAIWHRNYWDVIVPDEKALASIRNYIRFNPRNYDAMMKVGEPKLMGNHELLERLKVGFLASRGADAPHGHLSLKPGEVVMSGFLSPMERAVFKAGLVRKRPMIWVLPRGLMCQPLAHARAAVDAGRLLMVSPFADEVEAPSLRRAAWCNQYVLAHCDRMVVGHLNPGGMLACVLSEFDPEKEMIYL